MTKRKPKIQKMIQINFALFEIDNNLANCIKYIFEVKSWKFVQPSVCQVSKLKFQVHKKHKRIFFKLSKILILVNYIFSTYFLTIFIKYIVYK